MKYYSFDNDKHDKDFECGKKNFVNNSHIWVVDYNNVEEVEKMKEEVLKRVSVAQEESEK